MALCALLWPAAPSQAAAHWVCGLSQDLVRLVCVADAALADASSSPALTTARVRGMSFPLDTGRVYTVDLWSPPTELAFLHQLARATICYRSPGCEVTLQVPDAMKAFLAGAMKKDASSRP